MPVVSFSALALKVIASTQLKRGEAGFGFTTSVRGTGPGSVGLPSPIDVNKVRPRRKSPDTPDNMFAALVADGKPLTKVRRLPAASMIEMRDVFVTAVP